MSPSSSSPSSSPPQPQPKSSLRTHLKHALLPSLSADSITVQSHRAQEIILQRLPEWKAADRVSIYLSMPGGEARTEGLVRAALGEGKVVFVPVLCPELVSDDGVGKGGGGDEGGKHGGSGVSQGASAGTIGKDVGEAGEGGEKPKPKRKKRKMRMEMLRLYSLEEFEQLERDSWGIPSLAPSSLAGRENARGGVGPEGWTSPPGEDEKGVETERGAEGAEGKNGVVNGPGLDLIVVPGVAFDKDMARMGHGAGFYDGYLTRLVTEGRCKKPFLVGLCLAEQVLEPGRILMEEWDWRVDAVATGDGRLLTARGRG
ncbi:hypothetical protein KC345_g10148 [Hortaea werneckii]|nr:hypothetical protein KC345_g10148 [Hortaea werneckii]